MHNRLIILLWINLRNFIIKWEINAGVKAAMVSNQFETCEKKQQRNQRLNSRNQVHYPKKSKISSPNHKLSNIMPNKFCWTKILSNYLTKARMMTKIIMITSKKYDRTAEWKQVKFSSKKSNLLKNQKTKKNKTIK